MVRLGVLVVSISFQTLQRDQDRDDGLRLGCAGPATMEVSENMIISFRYTDRAEPLDHRGGE